MPKLGTRGGFFMGALGGPAVNRLRLSDTVETTGWPAKRHVCDGHRAALIRVAAQNRPVEQVRRALQVQDPTCIPGDGYAHLAGPKHLRFDLPTIPLFAWHPRSQFRLRAVPLTGLSGSAQLSA